MDTLLRDLRYALRTLRTRPAFTAAVVATLALGIGASTAVFTLVNAALLRPLPFTDPDRLVFLWGVAGPERDVRGASYLEVRDWREGSRRTLQDVAVYDPLSLNLRVADGADRVAAERVSASYFPLLGAQAARGRTFLAAEDSVPDAYPVAVISHDMWLTRFGGDERIVGRTMTLNDRAFTVVGVMAPEFHGLSFDTDVWVPMAMISLTDRPAVLEQRGSRWLGAVGRLADGVTMAQAQEELDGVAARLATAYPETNADRGVRLLSLHDYYLGDTRVLLVGLLVAVGLFLLIACANVAGLQLVRAASRRREMAVRVAMGASGRHLLRQLLVEGVVLALLGTGAGMLVALWGVGGLLPLLPDGALPSYVRVAPDWRVLAFAILLALASAALMGLVPARNGRRLRLTGLLKEGDRGAAGGIMTMRRPGVQQLLVIGEVAIALVLLVAAGLTVRSLQRQLAVDPGFRATGVLEARIELPAARYDADDARRFADALLARLGGRTGVAAVAVGSDVPMSGNTSAAFVLVEGEDDAVRYYRHRVSPGYFATLGIPIVQGRALGEADREGRPLAVVVNAAMARRHWPDGRVLGRRLLFGSDTATIVGVAGDARFRDLTTNLAAPASEPDVYFALAQRPQRNLSVALRGTSGDPAALATLLRAEVTAIDPGLPVYDVGPLETSVRQQTATERFGSFLFALFGGVALVLAAVGLYGLLAFVVGMNAREIAIRMALGASRGRVTRLVVRQGLVLALVGLLVGVGGAALVGHLLAAQLYGVSATDPVTFGAVAAVLLATALIASYLPARRAVAVDPQTALKAE
ncbi:MAG TPA: ABC transporter permease [Gemmatimonadaceae bacterium]|nr:ABC transporter permease [Gemmatimonadaceae bacterium]